MENFLRSNEYWSIDEFGIQVPAKYSIVRCPENRVGREKTQRFEDKKVTFSRQLIVPSWKQFLAKKLPKIFGIP